MQTDRKASSGVSEPTACGVARFHHDPPSCSQCDLLVGLDGLHVTGVLHTVELPAPGPGLVDRVRGLAPHGVDVALDCIGGEAVPASLELVQDRGRIGTIADYAAVERHGVRRPGGDRSAATLAALVGLHTAGRLQLSIQAALPLARAADANRQVETGHVRGKVVLVADDGSGGSRPPDHDPHISDVEEAS